jgi:hypothetical protein
MQHINTVTQFEQAHFNSSNITIAAQIPDTQSLLRLPLTNDQIISLSGAPSGSSIAFSVLAQPTTLGSEDVPAGVFFEVRNTTYIRTKNVIGVFRDAASHYGIYIKSVDLSAGAPKGMAARMLAVIVRQAFAIGGFSRVRLLAAGGRSWSDLDPSTGERWGGYVAWPTYGFDMDLHPKTLAMVPSFPFYPRGLRSQRKVSELLSLPGGREFWKSVGDGLYMDFDLSAPSAQSVKTLDTFLGKAGL